MFARKILKKVLGDRAGATAIEYGLILSFIVIAIMASLNLIASETINMWNIVESKVTQP